MSEARENARGRRRTAAGTDLYARLRAGERPELDAFVQAWGTVIPVLHSLRDTPQDPEWHAEGDVHVHTEMVLQELAAELDEVPASDHAVLFAATALHDVAKPLTTRVADIDGRERIVAPRHAERGRDLVLGELIGLGVPTDDAIRIAALVGAHHEPKRLVLRDEPPRAAAALHARASNRLLYHLERADMRGRVCPDASEQLELLELFRLLADEAGAWGTHPWDAWREELRGALESCAPEVRQAIEARSLTDAREGRVWSPAEALARNHSMRDGVAWFTLLVGPSGSGKSSSADEHVVSLDDLREQIAGDRADQSKNGQVAQAAKEQVRVHLRAKQSVTVDATNLLRSRRREWLGLARDYGAVTRVIAFVGPRRVLHQRNRKRPHPVPDDVLERQVDRYEIPWGDEADVVELRPFSP